MRYRIGAELARQLDPVKTYEEIAQELGISKQNAYTMTVLALGKLAIGLKQRLGVQQ